MQAAPTIARLLPPCTCRHASTSRQSKPTAGPSLVEVLRGQKTGAFALGKANNSSDEQSQDSSYESPRQPRGQRARLVAAEKRRTVLVGNLSSSTTPGDIRRLANSKVKSPQSVLEIVKLPNPNVGPSSRAIIEFDTAHNAVRFVESTKNASGPGSPQRFLRTSLVDPTKAPVTPGLRERTPLTLDRVPIPTSENGSIRYAATNAYSGRTVLITGLPAKVPYRTIIDRLAQEEYNVVHAPTFLSDERSTDDLVQIYPDKRASFPTSSIRTGDELPYTQYLVRLPTVAEAHRLARQWHATWPTWGPMKGESKVTAEVVW